MQEVGESWGSTPTALAGSCAAARTARRERGRPLQAFDEVFESCAAESPGERARCFRLRYKVYCIDNAFEDAREHPEGLETDAHDSRAIHSLMTHRASGRAIGTVRLLLPHEQGMRRPLPMQALTGVLASDLRAPFPAETTAEISRFAIDKGFHRHVPCHGAEADMPADDWRTLLLHLPVGLVKACLEMSRREGITHWAAVLEPSLLRLLARLGMHMHPLGEPVQHHGLRQPCWIGIDKMLALAKAERPDVWALLTADAR